MKYIIDIGTEMLSRSLHAFDGDNDGGDHHMSSGHKIAIIACSVIGGLIVVGIIATLYCCRENISRGCAAFWNRDNPNNITRVENIELPSSSVIQARV